MADCRIERIVKCEIFFALRGVVKYVVCTIVGVPDFRSDGWLPVGHHPGTWDDVSNVCGGPPGSLRQNVLDNLLEWKNKLQEKGVSGRLKLDGSFTSAKDDPDDFDALLIIDENGQNVLENDLEANELCSYSNCLEQGFDLLWYFEETLRKHRNHPLLADAEKVWDEDKDGNPKGIIEVRL